MIVYTLADGTFNFAVNGGEPFTLVYEATGFLPVHRQILPATLDYSWLPDVIMTALDANATTVDLSSITSFTAVLGSRVSDGSGARQAVLLIPPATQATIVRSDGTAEPVSKITVRATEYTVGAEGPNAMPAALPPGSGYTYAVEYSVDEAGAAAAQSVRFNHPLVSYVENFLHFPAGGIVPAGYYDRTLGSWIPSDNGRVVQIIDMQGDLAGLDIDGDGKADDSAALAALSVTDPERSELGKLYKPGQSLWRVPITHFTPWDYNWPFRPPDGAGPPRDDPPKTEDPEKDPCEKSGSIIEAENQTLGEAVDITGTPFRLFYRSRLTPGSVARMSVEVPVSGTELPPRVKRFDVTLEVAGQRITRSFPPENSITTRLTWDGLDGFGRAIQGRQPARVSVAYTYDGDYSKPPSLPQAFAVPSQVSISADEKRAEITMTRTTDLTLVSQNFQARLGLGGFALDVHHQYDPRSRELILGTGRVRNLDASLVVGAHTVIAGTGKAGFSGDEDPGARAQISNNIPDLKAAPDGAVYFVDGLRIRSLDVDGTIQTIAGTGIDPMLDALPEKAKAIQAKIVPSRIAISQAGLYFTDLPAYRGTLLRKISKNGEIVRAGGYERESCTTYFGGGWCIDHPFWGDGGLATEANLEAVDDMEIAGDGTIYLLAHRGLVGAGRVNKIRRITADGVIRPVGSDPKGIEPDREVRGMALGADGAIYYAVGGQIKQITADGRTVLFAGAIPGSCDPECRVAGDGTPALKRYLREPVGLTIGPRGSLYFAETSRGPVRAIDTSGRLWSVLRGEVSLVEQFWFQTSIIGVAADGSVLLVSDRDPDEADYKDLRIFKVTSDFPGVGPQNKFLPSDDGREIFVFGPDGRHLKTVNAVTGGAIYQFAYDARGLLGGVTDLNGRVTSIMRDGSGRPTGIRAPSGALTVLTTDAGGYLSSITDPSGARRQYTFSNTGLLTAETDPRGGSHRFTYDGVGHLVKDEQPGGGSWTLSRAQEMLTTEVTLSSGEGRKTKQRTEGSAPATARVGVGADGLSTRATRLDAGGSTSTTSPDGTVTKITMAPDPRFGVAAPFAKDIVVSTPGKGYLAISTEKDIVWDPATMGLVKETIHTKLNGQDWMSVYTGPDRRLVRTSPKNRVRTAIFDAQGRITRRQTGTLEPAEYSYDASGRLAKIVAGTGALARTVSVGYDDHDRPTSVTDPLGRTWGMVYDQADRIVRETLPGGGEVAFSYDGNGNITSVTPPGRMSHGFDYTPADALASYSPPALDNAPTVTTTTYNLDRQPMKIVRPDGTEIIYTYDSAGRLSTVTYPIEAGNPAGGRITVTLAYSPITGQVTSMATSDGEGATFGYDGALLRSVTSTGSAPGKAAVTYTSDFLPGTESIDGDSVAAGYDNDLLPVSLGALTVVRDAVNGLVSATAAGGVTETFSHNTFGEPMDHEAKYGGTSIFHQTVTRDAAGRVATKTEIADGVTTSFAYTYDGAGRLWQVTKNRVLMATYLYDANGNRVSRASPQTTEAGAYDDQDRALTYGRWSFTYSANGELKTKADAASGLATAYFYDGLGALRRVNLPGGKTIAYAVDAEGRRVAKKVDGVVVRRWFYGDDPLYPVAEYDGAGALIARFVGHQYIVRDGITYRIIADHLGSPRLIVNAATGAVAQRLDFDEYGRVLADSAPGFQPFGFVGGLYDPDTGLVRFGARDYDPVTGRWTAKDPIGFAGGGTLLYSYVGNDPVNFVDRTGRNPALVAVAAGAIAVGSAAYGLYKIVRWGWAMRQAALSNEGKRHADRPFDSLLDRMGSDDDISDEEWDQALQDLDDKRIEALKRIKEAAKKGVDMPGTLCNPLYPKDNL